jgi:hypothetical protein
MASEWLSRREYARKRGGTEGAVRWQIKVGRIVPRVSDGRISRQQADEAWLQHSSRRPPPSRSTPSPSAQIGALTAKAELIEHRLTADEASYIGRAAMSEQWQWQALEIQGRLLTLPACYSEQLAQTLGCDLLCARRILERFAHLLLTDLGALADQAAAAVERLH